MNPNFTYSIRANPSYQTKLCFIPNKVKDQASYICTPAYIDFLVQKQKLKKLTVKDGDEVIHKDIDQMKFPEKKSSAQVQLAIKCEFLYITFVTELAWFKDDLHGKVPLTHEGVTELMMKRDIKKKMQAHFTDLIPVKNRRRNSLSSLKDQKLDVRTAVVKSFS